ncbi:MAG: prolipoprotein diacylglyceryl transferase, partial [Oscillospiraceae bacterium]|nr:prolipoprotein diacylglyceryl transferase [Oscillospiraceae bacterium]
RWGKFINQEAYGAECSSDWLFAMGGNVIRSDPQIPVGSFVHPCFLYESAWCVLGFVLLHIYSKKLRTFDGELALLYVAWYGFGRAFIEQLRTDSLYAGPLKVSQWVGAVSFVAAMICLVIAKIKTSKSGRPLYVNTDASKELIEGDLQAELDRKAKKEKKAESIIADDESDEETDGEVNEELDSNSDEENGEEAEESAADEEETDLGEDKENDDGSEDN